MGIDNMTTVQGTRAQVRRPAPQRGADVTDPLGQYLSEIGRYALLTPEDEVELAQAIEAGTAATERLASGDKLTTADRVALTRAVRRAEEARRTFISSNLRLVVANARRYAGSGVDMLDLIQEGNLGLMHAVGKFDWRRGFKFSTYATFWIRQAMQRARSVHSRTIRIPVHVDEAMPVVKEARTQLLADLGRPPTVDELAEETGISPGIVERALGVAPTVALETPIGDGNAQLGDLIADAFTDWATNPDGWFSFVHGEILAHRPH